MKRLFLLQFSAFRSLSAWLVYSWKKGMSFGLLTALLAVFFVPFSVSSVHAANDAWQAEEVVRSHHKIKMKPGSALTFEIHYKNTGKTTWKNTGNAFVAVATVGPEKRSSNFEHTFWPDEPYRPAYLLQEQVKPGEVGFFRFPLQAPEKEGDYLESFQVVAKNTAWITGTRFSIPIIVTQNPSAMKQSEPQAETQPETVTVRQTDTTPNKVTTDADYVIKQDYPVRDSGYAAEWVGGNKVDIIAIGGETITQKLQAKNVGTKTWTNDSARFASVYTVRPNYHESQFYTPDSTWIDATQIKMSSDSVDPGEIAEFELTLSIPTVHATYDEQIRLAVENYSWMKNGELHVQIHSRPKEQPTVITPPREKNTQQTISTNQETPEQVTSTESVTYRDTAYQAQFLISGGNIELAPGQTQSYRVGFKNTGSKNWNTSGARFISLYTIDPNYHPSRFATTNGELNSGWINDHQVQLSSGAIAPGQIGFFDFTLTAPTTAGRYTEKFRIAAEDYTWVKGGELTIQITVEGDTTSPTIPSTPTTNLGPIMRVGIINAETTHTITADSPYEVRTGSGDLIMSMPARTEVNVTYNASTKQYTVQSGSLTKASNDYIIAQALDTYTIMELVSLERRLPWNQAINENVFRGSLEVRHSQATGKTWVINILPMEQYLKGIAETSSESPVEFLKVMSIAARTYATYHYERQTKHADEYFYVDSVYDQVYKGYALEKRHPRLTEAVDQTTGQVVTWTDPATGETKIAITPYFSSSDGRTRSWSEVWGGDVAWAKSVPVPHDVGKSLLGHGVGMSARGGLLMVVEDGATYDEVLKYFFQGIEIEDRY